MVVLLLDSWKASREICDRWLLRHASTPTRRDRADPRRFETGLCQPPCSSRSREPAPYFLFLPAFRIDDGCHIDAFGPDDGTVMAGCSSHEFSAHPNSFLTSDSRLMGGSDGPSSSDRTG